MILHDEHASCGRQPVMHFGEGFMHCTVTRLQIVSFVTFLLSTSLVFSQITIKEKVSINPKSTQGITQVQSSFQHTNKVTIPFAGSVDVISTIYAPWICRRFLELDSTIVVSDLQNNPGGGLGDYPAGAQLSFTLLVEDCANGSTEKIVYPVKAVQTLWDSPCGALYELGDIAYDENGDEVFNTFFILIAISPNGPVPPLSLNLNVGTGLVYFPNSTFFVVSMLDQCGGVTGAPGMTIRVEIVDGVQWGKMVDPITGKPVTVIDGIAMDEGAAAIYYNAWGEEPQQAENVNIRVTTSDGQFSSTQSLHVTPWFYRVKVTPGRSAIQSGDTTRLDIQMLNYDGAPSTGELVSTTYTIVQNDTLAFLYSPDSTQTGNKLDGVFPSVGLFIPDRSDFPDSCEVLVKVQALEPCPDCVATKVVPGNDHTKPGALQSGKTLNVDSLFASLKKKKAEEKVKKLSSKIQASTRSHANPTPKPTILYDGYTLPHDGLGRVTVKKKPVEGCIHVTFATPIISPGDRVLLNFTTTDANGMPVSVPASQPLDVFLINYDAVHGVMISQNGKSDTMVLDGALQPIWYIAADSITGDSVGVNIRAAISVPSVDTKVGTSQGTGSAKKPSPNNSILAKSLKNASRLTPALIRALGNDDCPGEAGCIEVITLEFSATPDEVIKGEPIELGVKLTRGGKPVNVAEENPLVTFRVGDAEVNEGEGLVDFTYGTLKGTTLSSVPYSDAKSGLVHFVADGSDYTNILPLRIRITATWVAETLSCTLIVTLRGDATIGKYFQQSTKPWGPEQYDKVGEKGYISDWGCALTCMAMAGTAKGVDVDPGRLNEWMKRDLPNYYFEKNHGVKWDAIGVYGDNSSLKKVDWMGDGLSDGEVKKTLVGTPLSASVIDAYMTTNPIVFAQVKNVVVVDKVKKTTEDHKHWVVLVKKLSKGYAILDPGYVDRVTLKDYSYNVYRIITYKQQH
jgi:hypothetical protein